MLRRNVLIFHSGALGDFVLTWPLGLALSRLWPQSRIIYVTQKQKGLLAEKVLRLEWADAENGWHHLFGEAQRLPDDCRNRLQSAHAVFAFGTRSDERWLKTAGEISGSAECFSASVKPPEHWSRHAVDYLVETLSGAWAVQAAVRNILSAIAAKGIPVARTGAKREAEIVIHPGSGSREKCWPLDNFLRVAEKLAQEGRRVSFVLGEVERERWPAADVNRLESAVPVLHTATYRDLLDVLSSADLFIGNDSGPGHLAAIIGIPSLILFGASDPGVWQPLGPRVSVLRRQPLSDLSVDDVEAAVRQPTAV